MNYKNVGFEFEEHVCNRCHDILTTSHSLESIAILNTKGTTFRCLSMGITMNESLKRLNNSVKYETEVL